MLTIVAAMSKNGVIGREGKMPWHLPEDLKRFKKITTGKVVIMGRKTYESIGKPLPNRINIVVSKQLESLESTRNLTHESPLICRDLKSAIEIGKSFSSYFELENEEVMIVGGAQIYAQAMELCDKMVLTILDSEYEGDTWFPQFDQNQWEITETEEHNNFKYVTYVRKK